MMHDDVLGFGDLSMERYELREKCEAIVQGNVEAEKKLAKLRAKANSTNSLQKEVDRYIFLSTLTV